MTTSKTNIDNHKIELSLKTMWTIIGSVVVMVAAYFTASQRIADKISETNERIDNYSRLMESQQNLIIQNRYKDSSDKAFIQLQINYLLEQINNKKK